MSPKFRLAVATILAVGSLTILAVTLNAAKTRESVATTSPPSKGRILRQKDKLKNKPDAAELAALRKAAKAQDTPEERQMEDTTPKHVPLKVKVRKEKEEKFKDLKNDHWVRDLEIEVKNTGTKPIYFLHLQLHVDMVGPDGKGVAFVLLYGRAALVDVTAPIKAEDVPIIPGETHIFTIADRFVKGYEGIVRDYHIKQPKKVQVIFQQITFGDGTGLWNASGEPLPHPKRAATTPCNQKGGEKPKGSLPLIAFNASGKSRWFESLPAVAPANFLSLTETDRITINADEPDVCCPGSSCTWARSKLDRCYCSSLENTEPDMPSVDFVSCSDSRGACSSITSRTEWCDYPNVDGTTFQLSCEVYGVFSCFDYDPVPPPPPPPSSSPRPPSPTPTPTPTPTPACPSPAPSPNCLPNEIPVWRPWPDCYWTCSVAQITGGGGGAGSGDEGSGGYGNPGCTNYYWVWYVSYDGGDSWEPTGEVEWAGCW